MNLYILIDRQDQWRKILVAALPASPDEMRSYYLAAMPHHALVVCRHRLALGHVLGRWVDATEEEGVGDVGLSHLPGQTQQRLVLHGVVCVREMAENPTRRRSKLTTWLAQAHTERETTTYVRPTTKTTADAHGSDHRYHRGNRLVFADRDT
jgi:hypothetical protein